MQAVAENQIGPSLPQALRLVRIARAEFRPLTRESIKNMLEEPDNTTGPLHISRQEAGVLSSNAIVVKDLEDVFSFRSMRRFGASFGLII